MARRETLIKSVGTEMPIEVARVDRESDKLLIFLSWLNGLCDEAMGNEQPARKYKHYYSNTIIIVSVSV